MKLISLLLVILALFVAGTAFAQVPQTMSYQGVLTDATGALVPDGYYDLTFRIYNVPTAGSALWTEAHTVVNHVQVSRGGFSVILGSLTPVTVPFNVPLYLGIQVSADPELSPRVALASSPYALGLQVPFALATAPNATLLSGYNFSGLGLAMDALSPGGQSVYALEPDVDGSGGFLSVARGGGANGFWVDGNYLGSGNPALNLTGTASSVVINTNATGDASVQLPDNSISAAEILDEPGIAQGHFNGQVVLPTGGVMTDIVTVTITTPASGYIVVTADGQHGFAGSATSVSNQAYLQIDETAGGSVDISHYLGSGYGSGPAGSHNFFTWAPISIHRTYLKAAGAYTFRLEGYAFQSEALSNYLWNPTITATFYPTSYGSVTTAPAVAERGGFSNVQLTSSAGNGPGAPAVQGSTVDLRELEVRAARAAAADAQAQRELVEARANAQMRARTAASPVQK